MTVTISQNSLVSLLATAITHDQNLATVGLNMRVHMCVSPKGKDYDIFTPEAVCLTMCFPTQVIPTRFILTNRTRLYVWESGREDLISGKVDPAPDLGMGMSSCVIRGYLLRKNFLIREGLREKKCSLQQNLLWLACESVSTVLWCLKLLPLP